MNVLLPLLLMLTNNKFKKQKLFKICFSLKIDSSEIKLYSIIFDLKGQTSV